MDKSYKPLFLILVTVSLLQLSKTYDLQRLSERIDKMELKILTEGMYTREDIHELQESMERIEGQLNLTYIDTEYLLSQTEIVKNLESSVAELTEFKLRTVEELGYITDSLQNLKEGLENEMELSANLRRHVSDLDGIINTLTDQNNKIAGDVHAILSGIKLLHQSVSTVYRNETDTKGDQNDEDKKADDQLPTSCLDALKNGQTISGVYTVQPDSSGDPVEVFCDQETDNGGWTVFQRREDGSVDFYRNWEAYKVGFGNLTGEFWLGNDNLHRLLTVKSRYELRVDLGDFDGNTAYAKFNHFMVGSESDKYRLTVEGYSGDAGDSLAVHNGQLFSTRDRDNDRTSVSCSQACKGGWWYNMCYSSNLNGLYNTNKQSRDDKNVCWYHWKSNYPLKSSEMKFRELV